MLRIHSKMFIGRTVPLLKKEVVSVHSKCSSFLCPHHFSFVSSHSTPHFFSSLNFSSAAAQAQVDLKVYKNPSVLENVDVTKPGTAWYFMQKHYADSKAIRHSDFLRLLKAVRPSHPSDGKLVITALRDMKRCNRFICTPEIADASVKAIMKSVSPPIDSSSSDNTKNEYDHHIHTTITDPKYQRQAACTVFNAFLDTQTGLYTSLPTKQLEICLSLLLQGIKYGENNNDEQIESKDIASMVFQTMERLIHRASNPTRHMKKRERRTYLLRRKCCEGPSPKCIDLSVNIILSLRNGDEEQDSKCLNMVNDLIYMYSTKKHLGSVMESTLDIVRESQQVEVK